MRSLTLEHVGRFRVALREADLPPIGHRDLLIESHCSAISPGTESMIFNGMFPKNLPQDKTIKSLRGGFDYPFTYGYALAGEVVDAGAGIDSSWRGRRIFAFHPHCDNAVVHADDCIPIPDDIPTQAALFLPNVESALSFVMDANPKVGERIMVFGQGVVGLLTTSLLAAFPFTELIAADPLAFRRERSLGLGAGKAVDPSDPIQWEALKSELFQDRVDDGLDLAVDVSGTMDALNQAIELTGFDGRILIGSWYGTPEQPLNLGGHFHRRRQRLISSQVSTLNPALTGRWNKARRIETAWQAIRKIAPQGLITHAFDIHDCQHAFELVSQRDDNVLQAIFRYQNADT
ncbi:MAG: zinc-binding alcohol dehydrogenase [Pseudomonadota bacterium]